MNEADRFLQERLEQQVQRTPQRKTEHIETVIPPQIPVRQVQRCVTMDEAWRKCWATWSVQGRASRSEFWFMVLLNFLISIVFVVLSAIADLKALMNVVSSLWALIYLIPGICLEVRRFHDIGKSGWWAWLNVLLGALLIFMSPLIVAGAIRLMAFCSMLVLVVFVLLVVWFCTPSEPRTNKYGSVPNLEA